MKNVAFKRRDFLKLAGWSTLGLVGACTSPESISTVVPTMTQPTVVMEPTATLMPAHQKKRALRIAHMTDFHAQPEGTASDGIKRALRHAQSQEDLPDMILNTGDCVMDSLQADKARTEAQWDVFNGVIASDCTLPIFHAIGNHDVWGWDTTEADIKNDPLYGKEMAVEKLGLANRYYSFDRAGWHFVVLDSVHLPNAVSPYPYIGEIDEEQFQWLIADVGKTAMTTNMHICIVSHIPILAACMYFDGPNEESGNWVVPAAWMHIDARRFREYFSQTSRVRLCLSGHTHQYEVLDYLGVRYMTNGAVCGNWWNGTYMNFPPSYVMVNLYDDGSSDSEFVAYDET